jgi:hypothetical protein
MESNDAHEALEAFQEYAQAFQSLDPRAAAQHFHAPALMATPNGVSAVADASAAEQVYRGVMAELPAMGYARSVFPNLSGRRLSRDLAVVSGGCIWETASGKEIRRFDIMYTLCRTAGVWKILTALIYDRQKPA